MTSVEDPGPVPSDLPLTLDTLGVVALTAPPDDAPLLTPGKPLALIIYLALAPRRTARREHLVDLLWADLPPDKARHALRQTLWYLRQLLGPDSLPTTRAGDITLGRPFTTDRDRFLAALEAGDLDQAITVYQGEFLANFAAPGGVEFEHWADVERQRLRSAFLRAAETRARRCLDQGHFREAQHLARRARDAARTSEAAWRLLLETHSAGGDQLGFAMEASALSRMLETDQREPEPATRLLLSRGKDDRPELPGSTALNPALVGREREFAAIIAAWGAAVRHGGRHLHLSAPPGLGKSRLLADVRGRLRGLGGTVVTLRANPGDRAIPYSYLGEMARALTNLPGAVGVSPASASSLVALNPVLSTRFAVQAEAASGGEALRRRSAALTELLTAVCEEQPCAVLLDDLHWADAASRQALRPLLDRIGDLRLLILTAARPVAESTLTGEGAQVLTLAPLSVVQAQELLASLGQLPEEHWCTRLAEDLTRASGGSPLLVLETLQLAVDRGWLALRDGAWRCERPAALAQALREGSALQHRVATLDELSRRLLVILAVAGTPVSLRQLSRATTVPERILDDALTGLEHRGLIHRSGEFMLPAHDEIAAAALEVAGPEAIPSVHGSLAMALLEGLVVETPDLVRAGRHLGEAGRPAERVGVFGRYVAAFRERGDRRRVVELAREFLGEGIAPSEVARLVRGLSVWDRFRLSSARRVAGLLLLAGAAAAIGTAMVHRPPPDAVLLLQDGQDHEPPRRLELHEAGWQSGRPLDVRGVPRVTGVPSGRLDLMTPAPDGRRWLIAREHLRQPETYDIYLRDSTGQEQRLMRFRGDDYFQTWAPDGSAFTWVTSHWSPPGADNYDLAAMDPRTGAIRRLTAGRPADQQPAYSPEATRLLFYRGYDDRLPEACWMPQDGSRPPSCFAIPRALMVGSHGWQDGVRVLVSVEDTAGIRSLVRFDLETRQATVLHRYVRRVWLSPDRRWLAVSLSQPGDLGQTRILIHPLEDPSRARELTGLRRQDPHLLWMPQSRAPSSYLAAVRIVGPPDRQLRTDTGYRFQLRLIGQDGAMMLAAAPATWSVSDSSVLEIDSTGLAKPLAAGSVTVHVSMGGWRTDSLPVRVAPARDTFLFREEWQQGIEARWQPFGEPRPYLRITPTGAWFINAGEGSYSSGAYSRARWEAGGGLGVEARVSVPLTRGQGQSLQVAWVGGLDSGALQHWDHLGGALPLNEVNQHRYCAAAYPAGEGPAGKVRFGFAAGPWGRSLPVDSSLGDGREFRLRVQLFPDGRCGLAVDGRPLLISPNALPQDYPYALLLGMASYRTEVRHGPIEVWRGVRNDVQWALLDGEGPANTPGSPRGPGPNGAEPDSPARRPQ
jgi:DNA-binding SARP family transcriptional activator